MVKCEGGSSLEASKAKVIQTYLVKHDQINMIATILKYRKTFIDSMQKFLSDNVSRLGAAIAFYSIFSLPSLLIIFISIAGYIYGEEAVTGKLIIEIQHLIGKEGAEAVQTMVAGTGSTSQNIIASLAGLFTLILGASGVLGEMQAALNIIWKTNSKDKAGGMWNLIRSKILTYSFVLALCFLFLVSLVFSTAISALQVAMEDLIPGYNLLIGLLNFFLPLFIISGIISLIYRYLPEKNPPWASAIRGAIVATILFLLGKYLISIYLGESNLASTYGAASSVIILISWIYFIAQIFLFGAEFAEVHQRTIERKTV